MQRVVKKCVYRITVMCRTDVQGSILGPDMENKGEVTVRLGEVIAQNYSIFCQFRSKLAITHTVAI